MPSISSPPEAGSALPEIASSWTRSRLSGLREDAAVRFDHGPVATDGTLARAADPVMAQAAAELGESPVKLVLADRAARVVDIRFAERSIGRSLDELGVRPGVRLAEELVGTNAVGTPVETRQGLLVRGAEHFLSAFQRFTCYGQPIIHPITGRLEGVLDMGGPSAEDLGLLPTLVRRIVRDIEERLQLGSSDTERALLAAFQTAARPRHSPVVVVGQGLVLATPAALELLEPADHATVRTCAEEVRAGGEVTRRLTLPSGRSVRLRCAPIDGVQGVLVEITPERCGRDRGEPVPAQLWPLLIVGEAGTGRSTEARQAAGAGSATLDAAEVVRWGEQAWATTMTRLLGSDAPAMIVENIQLLSEQLSTLLAQHLRDTRRRVVLTATPGEQHVPLATLCADRRDLVPLRRRRHEIPRLAQRMLAETTGTEGARFTPETLRVLAMQPWPGNLTELDRVVRTVAAARSAGDIIPADLPASHRAVPATASPFRQAEREIIVAAIEAAGGNRLRAARALGMSRSTLYNRMRALHIP